MKNLLAIKTFRLPLALSVCALALSWCNPAHSCIAIPREGPVTHGKPVQAIHLDEQRAFLWAEGQTQHMMLSVKHSGGSEEFAWVIPVESRPKMEVDKGAPFSELRRITTIRQMQTLSAAAPGGAASKNVGGVVVVERREEGPYDLAVLEADNGKSLFTWLNKNQFHVSKDAKGVLDHYVQRKFCFVAARIRHQDQDSNVVSARLREGNIAPLHLSYKAKNLSYPLKVTSGNPGMSYMEFYVFNPKQQVNPAFKRQNFNISPMGKEGLEVTGNGNGSQLEQCPTLRRLLKGSGTLAKYTGSLQHTQREQDLVFAKL